MDRLGRVALFCGLLSACAHLSAVKREALPDGSYRVTCRDRLGRCVTPLEETCKYGYEVLQAHEDVSISGPREYNEPTVSSEVVARCRLPNAMFGGQKAPPPSPPAAASPSGDDTGAAAKPAAPQTCFPGATQACVGAGACKGGQQCLADGTAFGPCDCGGVAAPAVPGADAPAPR